jgi:hypothetical protein
MKQWLYYGWVTFKHWFLFTSWTIFHSKEDRAELVKLYNERLFQKKQMAIYVAHLSQMKSDGDGNFEGIDWYIGDLKSNYFGIVDDYYKNKDKEKKDE